MEPVTYAGEKYSASMWRNTNAVESWSWEGHEGKKSKVVVYTHTPFVELKVSSKSYGKKKVKENKVFFDKVIYEPGELIAIAYDQEGREISKSSLVTAQGKTILKITPDKTSLLANGQDLCFLDIELTGQNGMTKASCDQKITVKVEGAGILQAYGSARPNMAENFYSDTHTTYFGKALAVIRAGYETGKINIIVSGDELEEKTLTLEVK